MGLAYDPPRSGDDPPRAAAADNTDEDDNDEDGEHLADLQFAMQRLYRATVKKPRFKVSTRGLSGLRAGASELLRKVYRGSLP